MDQVFFVVDNGSSHPGRAAIDRIAKALPTPKVVHLPIQASCLHQIEIYFSIIQRKVLAPNYFRDLDRVVDRQMAFQDYWQDTCTRSIGSSPAPTSTTCSPVSALRSPSPPQPEPIRHRTSVRDH